MSAGEGLSARSAREHSIASAGCCAGLAAGKVARRFKVERVAAALCVPPGISEEPRPLAQMIACRGTPDVVRERPQATYSTGPLPNILTQS